MKVLIVEDVTINQKLLENLMPKNTTCTSVKKGEEGIIEFKKALKTDKPYDLVCLDINLPGMSGFEVLKEIRKMENGPKKVKTLMTTSAAEKESVMKAIHYGCDGYLLKPYNKQNIEEHLIELKLYDPEEDAADQSENQEAVSEQSAKQEPADDQSEVQDAAAEQSDKQEKDRKEEKKDEKTQQPINHDKTE